MAKRPNGARLGALSSSTSGVLNTNTGQRILYLGALGATAVAIHAAFRFPLHVPGLHGMEWMAVLTFAYLTAPGPWTGTLTGAAAAVIGFAPFWGFHDPLSPAGYLISGWVFDILLLVVPRRLQSPVRLALLAAVALMVSAFIPLPNPLRARFTALAHNLSLFFGAHLVFGLIGGLIGTLLGTLAVRHRLY